MAEIPQETVASQSCPSSRIPRQLGPLYALATGIVIDIERQMLRSSTPISECSYFDLFLSRITTVESALNLLERAHPGDPGIPGVKALIATAKNHILREETRTQLNTTVEARV